MIQEVVVNEFYEEIERAKQPGYVSRYDDFEFEYSDAARSRPARFDQPHAHPAEQPHTHADAKGPRSVGKCWKTALSPRSAGDGRGHPRAADGRRVVRRRHFLRMKRRWLSRAHDTHASAPLPSQLNAKFQREQSSIIQLT